MSRNGVISILGRIWDPLVYRLAISTPLGPRHSEYAKGLRLYVSSLSDEDREFILSRRDDVYDAYAEWTELNESVLLRLGFDEGEARNLRMNRLNSPGMRHVVEGKADEMHGCGFNAALSRKVRQTLGNAVCDRWRVEMDRRHGFNTA